MAKVLKKFFFHLYEKVPQERKLNQETHLLLVFIFYRYEKSITTLGIY
jgi:hypothetical protein